MASSSSSPSSSADKLYVVSVDTRGYLPGHWTGYAEMTCKPSYFQDNIIKDPKIVCFESPIFVVATSRFTSRDIARVSVKSIKAEESEL